MSESELVNNLSENRKIFLSEVFYGYRVRPSLGRNVQVEVEIELAEYSSLFF